MKRLLGLFLCTCIIMGFAVPAHAADDMWLMLITDAVFGEMSNYSEGRLLVGNEYDFCYLDEYGEEVFSLSSEDDSGYMIPTDFCEGLASVVYISEGGIFEQMFFDRNGVRAFAIPMETVGADTTIALGFSEGVARGHYAGGNYFIMDREGNRTDVNTGGEWRFLSGGFKEGFVPYRDKATELIGYRDREMNVVIPAQFEEAGDFGDGLAAAKKDGKWGMIDKSGEFVMQPEFEELLFAGLPYRSDVLFTEGLTVAVKDGKAGFIDRNGSPSSAFEFEQMYILTDGLAAASKDGESFGYVDRTGKWVVEPQYDDANGFYNGVALVGSGGEYKLIDKTGSQVGDQTWWFDTTYMEYTQEGYDSLKTVKYERDGWLGLAKLVRVEYGSPFTVYYSGEKMEPSSQLINIDGRVFYPMEDFLRLPYVMDSMGASEEDLAEYMREMLDEIYMWREYGDILADNMYIYDGRIYCPLRVMCDELYLSLEWDEQNGCIYIEE